MVWFVFFVMVKQKTAYEMRISDWSSDVCSSDLLDVDTQFDVVGVVQVCDVRRGHVRVVEPRHHQVGVACGVLAHADGRVTADLQIGRESGRERVCQYV